MKPHGLSLFFLCLLLLGCGGNKNAEVNKSGGNDDPGQQNASAQNDELTLHVKSWDETLNLVASKKGKVVVIDLWALW